MMKKSQLFMLNKTKTGGEEQTPNHQQMLLRHPNKLKINQNLSVVDVNSKQAVKAF